MRGWWWFGGREEGERSGGREGKVVGQRSTFQVGKGSHDLQMLRFHHQDLHRENPSFLPPLFAVLRRFQLYEGGKAKSSILLRSFELWPSSSLLPPFHPLFLPSFHLNPGWFWYVRVERGEGCVAMWTRREGETNILRRVEVERRQPSPPAKSFLQKPCGPKCPLPPPTILLCWRLSPSSLKSPGPRQEVRGTYL